MIKRAMLIGLSILLLTLPLAAWAVDIPAKVFENGLNNNPKAVSGAKVEVFGGYGFKSLLSSTESGGDGGCILKNVPLGKNVLVSLTKPGYIPQKDIRSYSDADVEGVILWMGSTVNVVGLYKDLGETFDAKKGQVYLEISDENTGGGIDGIQLSASSGKVFDLGQGEYLIANAEGANLKIGIAKPGYSFDIESATIPLFSGGMTQYYIKVQPGGAVYSSKKAGAVTSAAISGFIKTAAGGPISAATIAFTSGFGGETIRPPVNSDGAGFYRQEGFPTYKIVKVTPTKPGFTFRLHGFVFTSPGEHTKNFTATMSM